MSWQASKIVWENSKQTGGLKLTLLAIADFASPGNGWTCEAAIETLAGMVGVSDRQIKKNLKALEGCGELVIERQIGRGNTNQYSLAPLVKGELEDTFYQQEKVNPSTEKVNSGVIKGEPEDTQTNRTKITNKNKTRGDETLIAFFEGMTAFTPPHETTDTYAEDWLAPMQAILGQSKDFAEAEARVTYAIQHLRKIRYTIISPKSILKTALNWQPGDKAGSNGHYANGSNGNTPDKNQAMENIRKAVTTYGAKKYKQAMETLGEPERAIVKSMASSWRDVCMMDKQTFQVKYYQALKGT